MIQTFVVSVNWYAIMCEKSKYTSPARTQTSCRSAHGLSHMLTHWGLVTHICVGNLTIIGPDNGLSPGRRQAIIRTNVGILLMEPLRTNFSEISIEISTFSLMKMHLKVSSGKWRPFCLGLNVLKRLFSVWCQMMLRFAMGWGLSSIWVPWRSYKQ